MCDVQHECKHFIPRIPGACVCCGTTRATCVRLLWNNPCCLLACSLLDDTLCTPCEQPFPKPVLTYVSICQARTVCSPAYGRRGPGSCTQIPWRVRLETAGACISQPRNCWRVRLMWNNPALRVMQLSMKRSLEYSRWRAACSTIRRAYSRFRNLC